MVACSQVGSALVPLTRLKLALGGISGLRGVQPLILAWRGCGIGVHRAAVAGEAKQKFLSYYFVLPEASLQIFLIK